MRLMQKISSNVSRLFKWLFIKGYKGEFSASDAFFERANNLLTDKMDAQLKSTYFVMRARVEEMKGNFKKAAYYYKEQTKVLTTSSEKSLKTVES